ncbi:MAG TPA: PQQ-dependent catabolism-associated CXXCW motif protein [Ferrovibrio sp.]|uniref:PQQ-dependent catabolism-associated CXXCW motif protein n=1 Tax=Ferrovibrio sp. TaxID=1917215 RepID=UPI002ED507B4
MAAILILTCLCGLRAQAAAPEPEGYRMGDYRGELPATLRGATVLDAQGLYHMMTTEPVILIDVFPQPPRPEGLPQATLWHPPVRQDIPGSIWLANTGYGGLNDEMAAYFSTALEKLSLGDRERKLVFYCDANCWMSWNAAKRAAELGYRGVYWFPGGVQDWIDAGYPVLPNAPLPVK